VRAVRKVLLIRDGGGGGGSSRTRLERSTDNGPDDGGGGGRPAAADELVYIEASPDFCDPDARTGSPGTAGRRCDRASDGADRCDVMCCGRGHAGRRRSRVEKCRCTFHWCCAVRCDRCRTLVDERVCR